MSERVLTTPTPFTRTSEYGWRSATDFHHGMDLFAPTDTPIMSMADGVVERSVRSGTSGFGKYGDTILIHHPQLGVRTLYAHLSRRDVQQGASVRGGQIIGAVGTTAGTVDDPDRVFTVSSPHVHWEVLTGAYPASAGGPEHAGRAVRTVNPREFFRSKGQTLGQDPYVPQPDVPSTPGQVVKTATGFVSENPKTSVAIFVGLALASGLVTWWLLRGTGTKR